MSAVQGAVVARLLVGFEHGWVQDVYGAGNSVSHEPLRVDSVSDDLGLGGEDVALHDGNAHVRSFVVLGFVTGGCGESSCCITIRHLATTYM